MTVSYAGAAGEIADPAGVTSTGWPDAGAGDGAAGTCEECEDAAAETTTDDGRDVCWPCHDRLQEAEAP